LVTGRRGRRLVLLRHGQTAWNALGRAHGHPHLELDEPGHAQAARAAATLAALRPSRLWTSDLARARQTASYLEQATGLSAAEDPRLREYDVGDRQGMDMSEFAEAFPAAYDAWRSGDDGRHPVPNAETTADVEKRLAPALLDCLAELAAGETGIVVTHGACLKIGMLSLLGWPLSQAVDIRGVDNCAWVVLGERPHGQRLRLVGYNLRATGGPEDPRAH
jgi:probable phosphoglycerate mutase